MDAGHSEEDVQALLSRLSSDDPKRRANALRGLAEAPLADRRILAAAEALLHDETLTLLSIPYVFGEVRWHAAAAVAALRGALQMSEVVRIPDVPVPLTTDKIGALARAAGLAPGRGGIEGVLETMARLRQLGLVPRRTLVRRP